MQHDRKIPVYLGNSPFDKIFACDLKQGMILPHVLNILASSLYASTGTKAILTHLHWPFNHFKKAFLLCPRV